MTFQQPHILNSFSWVPEQDHGSGKLFLLPSGFREHKRISIKSCYSQNSQAATEGTNLIWSNVDFHNKIFIQIIQKKKKNRKQSCDVTFFTETDTDTDNQSMVHSVNTQQDYRYVK